MMKYEWEEAIEDIFDFDDINNTLDELATRLGPIGFTPQIMGVIMANTFDNEACLIVNPEFDKKKDVAIGDLWLDASGDVEAQRKKAMDYDQ